MAVFAEAAEAAAELVAWLPMRINWCGYIVAVCDYHGTPRGGGYNWPTPTIRRHRVKWTSCFPVLPETDPDEVVGWTQVAAAQVAVVDEAMAGLAGCLQELHSDWSYCLVGLGGVPLGSISR